MQAAVEAYHHPAYYEIAFASRELRREVDFFEAAIAQFSGAPVRTVFELGAGTAPYLAEWHQRGYRYCGLDLSPEMLDFAAEKARRQGVDAVFIEGDMRALDPALGPFDLAYVLLGSLYVRSNGEFLGHLEQMAGLLPTGALYLLDSFVWFRIFHDYRRSWSRRRGDIAVRTRYRAEITDGVAQTYDECLSLAVDDRGRHIVVAGRVPAKVFFPQEFLALVELSGRFEFVGWYNDFNLAAPLRPEGRHIAVLRRR